MSRYYSLETIRDNAYDVTLANGAKHRCVDPDVLLDIEPAEVRENVKGEWIEVLRDTYGGGHFPYSKCSVCQSEQIMDSNFCPNCGAAMREEETERQHEEENHKC